MKIGHDLHIHTALSLCANGHDTALEGFYERAGDTGVRILGISNHFWDSAIPCTVCPEFYGVQNFEHISKVLSEIAGVKNFRMLFGAEGEYDPVRDDVAITEETAEKLDYIIVSNAHTHMTLDGAYYNDIAAQKEILTRAFEAIVNGKISRYITAVAHPFEVVGYSTEKLGELFDVFSDDELKRLFDMAAERGIAYEINHDLMNWKTKEQIAALPTMRLYRLAKKCGCKFIFGSDAHGYEGYRDYAPHLEYVTELIGITENDIADIVK